MTELELIVDLDERGWFCAHVEDGKGNVLFEFSNEDENGWPDQHGLWLVEDGWMRHGRDVDGLLEYLKAIGVVGDGAHIALRG
ncbi:MAG: hypothetical protein NZ533_11550 [Casimicrobiaceae bacterium]|nr:hypothetical protein [Casimicrobiaceae bacterium]